MAVPLLLAGVPNNVSPPASQTHSDERENLLLLEGLFSNPSELQDGCNKRSIWHPNFRPKSSIQPLWLRNQCKVAPLADTRLATLDAAQQQRQKESHEVPSSLCEVLLDNEFHELCEQGQLDRALDVLSRMDRLGMVGSSYVYLSLLKACNKKRALPQTKRVHAHLARHKLELNGLLGDYLVVTLAKCGGIEEARHIFQRLSRRTVFSWTAMISVYTGCGQGEEALRMLPLMLKDGVEPDHYTFVSLFKACGSTRDLGKGRKLHAYARRKGFVSDIFVSASLVSMYGKCGTIAEAEKVFGGLCQRDIVSWSAMLAAYVEQGQGEKALQLYRQTQEEGVYPDRQLFVSALQACDILAENEETLRVEGLHVKVRSLEICHALHADARRKGFASDAFVGATLVNVYRKCGTIMEAQNVFNGLSQCDVVSWSAMISAYVEQGQGDKALWLYRQMQVEGVSPDQQTFAIALQACDALAEKQDDFSSEGACPVVLKICQALHADAGRKGFVADGFVGTRLVSVYGKCGNISEAKKVFNGLSQRDIVSWTAMLSAYVEQGQGEKALHLYRQMLKEHVALDDVILVCILQACSDTGSVEICRQVHFSIVSAGYDLNLSLSNTLIHAYGSCASMVDAQAVFDELPEPDVVSWSACIAGYAGEGKCVACLKMFEDMLLASMKPDGVTFASLLSACSHAGLVAKGVGHLESMSRYHDLTPELKHYVIIIDLLARAGDFRRVENILSRMPMQADFAIWLCLLGACRTHGHMELGKQMFDRALSLQPKEAAMFILMSNIYADAGLPECAEGAWRVPSLSSIEHGQEEVSFMEDPKHPLEKHMYDRLHQMRKKLEQRTHASQAIGDITVETAEVSICDHSVKLEIAFGLLDTPMGQPFSVRKNMHVCRDCHQAMSLTSIMKKREIIVIDANRVHHFKDSKCSCGENQ